MFFAVQKPDITIFNEIQAQLTNAYRFVLLNYEKRIRTMYNNTRSFVMEEILLQKHSSTVVGTNLTILYMEDFI